MIRFFDFVFSFIAIFMIFPFIVLLSIILKFTGEGKIFFLQERIGKYKKKFKVIKFATMLENSPNIGAGSITELNDPRILPLGKILRKTKIDELPQLINFLKGDLNLIGPRPGLQNQIQLREYREKDGIFDIRPGITGLSQVLGYDMSNPKLLSKIDKLYINKNNLRIDICILIATVFKPFKSKVFNIYKDGIENIEVQKNV